MAGQHESDFSNPVINWIDTRLPIFTMMQKEYGSFPTPKNFNYFWNFGALAMVIMMIMIATGIFLAMNYQPNTELAFEFRAAHHARRELRLAAPLRAPERCVDVLHRHLHPHLPRPVLRLLQDAARTAVDDRRGDPADHDGDRVHGLRAALGPDVLLGRHRHHQPVLRLPDRRPADRDLAVGRLQRRQPDAEPVLLAALPAAVRAGRRGVPACRRAARRRLEQPARHRREVAAGHAAVPSVLHGRRTASASACS